MQCVSMHWHTATVMCTNTNVSTAAAAADQTGRLIGLRCPVMSADVGVGGKKKKVRGLPLILTDQLTVAVFSVFLVSQCLYVRKRGRWRWEDNWWWRHVQ